MMVMTTPGPRLCVTSQSADATSNCAPSSLTQDSHASEYWKRAARTGALIRQGASLRPPLVHRRLGRTVIQRMVG
jgi:hypothetical protein